MKQAVVLIHGIGEQKPMDTLRGFVSAVLQPATEGHEQYWSKPDPISESFELRRLQSTGRTKTHFYEYYWAYHVDGTKLWHLGQWYVELLFRKWRNIPSALRSMWLSSWILTATLVILACFGGLAFFKGWYDSQPQYGPMWFLSLLITGSIQGLLIRYVGDAARYLSPHPQNITLRQKIRSDGLQLLRKLHDSHDYDRIVIVGHSLGSVIGYDIITRLWIDYNNKYDFKNNEQTLASILTKGESPQPVIRDKLHEKGLNLTPGMNTDNLKPFMDTQLEGWREQRGWGNPWRITDFVTLGSPLAHAMLLLARDKEEFDERKRQRELPTCPPVTDEKSYAYSAPAAYQLSNGKLFTPLILHHAAPFAVTQWTNIFFPARLGLFGDIIGGPLQNVFGPGINDIPVRIRSWRRITPFSHTAYWNVERTEPSKVLENHGVQNALDALKSSLALNDLRKFGKPRDFKAQ